MAGSPPHLDLFDYKPELVRRNGENCPESFLRGRRFAFTSGVPKLLGTPQRFAQHGQSGAWVSDALPHLPAIADELCFIKSMHTEQFNHAPAELLLFTGSPQFGRPSMGSWVTYGLGSESQNLPGFIVLVSSGTFPSAGNSDWSNGFLPSVYQGVQCRSPGRPGALRLQPRRHGSRHAPPEPRRPARPQRDAGRGAGQSRDADAHRPVRAGLPHADRRARGDGHHARAAAASSTMYGAQPGAASFANNCLLARRLIEQGVRFVQLHDWGWDFHGTGPARTSDQAWPTNAEAWTGAVAALIRDLKRAACSTNAGHLGRRVRPHAVPRRPHRQGARIWAAIIIRSAFTLFLAGGGIKRRDRSYGSSDELGFDVGEKPVHVHDLQATILHLLGLDHTRLTYRFQGRDFRLTDVSGNVVGRSAGVMDRALGVLYG